MISDISSLLDTDLAYRIYAPCMYLPDREKYNRKIASLRQEKNVSFLGAEKDGKLAGILICRRLENRAEIIGIAVDSTCRKQGIGRKMLENLLASGFSSITAETDSDAVGFYRSCGFETTPVKVEKSDGVCERFRCFKRNRQQDTLVVLLHGFCQGAKNMQFWKRNLSDCFPHILTPDLPTRYGSFEKCLEVLTHEINRAEPEKYASLCIAGHSMGGLMAREYLHRNRPANAKCLVCVGTPHYGSKLADIALLLPGAGRIWKPLNALQTSARKTITSPQIPGLKTGVIVSTNNGHWPGKLFLSKNADGLVESSSALAPDADSSAFTPVNHVRMQYDPFTAGLIKNFFLSGNF